MWLALVALGLGAFLVWHLGPRLPDERVPVIDHEMRAISIALAQYKTEFGVYPSGDSRTICRALRGENAKKMRFIDMKVMPDGVLIDPWGTPYRIYYSGDLPLIRSAGPNKQFDESRWQERTDDYFAP